MHRVFCTDIPAPGGCVEVEPREAEHLFKVFRARPGESVELLDGHGVVAQGVIEDRKSVRITGREVVPEPEEKLHLCCALPRKQKLDQLLKQAAELGAWSIRPVRCMRSVAEGGPRERWDLLLREACKQSGNPFLPVIEPEVKLPEALEKLQQENIKIYYGSIAPAESGGGFASAKAVVIGPEGGFAPEELEMMKKCNAEPLNLGPFVLRLETAAICALSVMRRLSVVAVMVLAVLAAGCSCSDENENLIKGESLLKTGDANGARDYFRMALAENPADVNACLSLAKACEMLDEPFEAIYAYQMYLKNLPANADGRAEAESKLAELKIRAAKQVIPEEEPASSEEMEELRQRCEAAETKARTSRQVLSNLNKQNNDLRARIAQLEKQRGSRR